MSTLRLGVFRVRAIVAMKNLSRNIKMSCGTVDGCYMVCVREYVVCKYILANNYEDHLEPRGSPFRSFFCNSMPGSLAQSQMTVQVGVRNSCLFRRRDIRSLYTSIESTELSSGMSLDDSSPTPPSFNSR